MPAPRDQLPPIRRWLPLALLVGLTAALLGCSSTSNNAGTSPSTSGPSTSAGSATGTNGGQSSTSLPATTPASSTTTPTAPSSTLQTALTGAYQQETGMLATYRNVVAALGSVGPFPNTVTAEQQQVSTVTTLMDHHAISPPSPDAGQESPSTLSAACALGVTLEQQAIAFYDDQIPKVSAYPDLTSAFDNLQAAARDNHLPAFQRC